MIALSPKEKRFLKDLVAKSATADHLFFTHLVDEFLQNIEVHLDFNKQSVSLHFDNQAYGDTKELEKVAKNTSWTFLKFIKLLLQLEKDNFLYLYKEPVVHPHARYGQLADSKSFISYPIYDPEIKTHLIDYSFRTIVIGQALIDFVTHDFKTEEQLRHEENVRISEQSLKMANESFLETKKSIDLSLEGLEEARKNILLSEQNLEEVKKSVELSSKALEESSRLQGVSKTAILSVVVLVTLGLFGSIGETYYASTILKNATTKTDIKLDNEQFSSLEEKLKRLEAVESKLDVLASQMNTKDTLVMKVANFPEKK